MRNLAIAFPDSSIEWRKDILKKNARELARLISDAIRLPSLSPEWVARHVSCPELGNYKETLNRSEGRGILIATGHLGSFELMGHAIGLLGHPLAAVAREFKLPRLDRWWKKTRESRGNNIIGRKGAFKEIVRTLQNGKSVAVLCDQNVTKSHAVFVDLFGRKAATSGAVALAAIRTEAPVFVASIKALENDRYSIVAKKFDFTPIYKSETLTPDQKILSITQSIVTEYESMIRAFPEGWFWMHRRWKTRPPGEPENIYD